MRAFRALIEKGRGFTEEDKESLRAVELELLRRVVPNTKRPRNAGQVELSTSPFYHPILPLLCDTDVYRRTHPDSRMPREPFRHPDDATEQLSRAVAYHERLFGQRPVGLWPSEGSVSDAMVPLVVQAGFQWMATDEEILARTVGNGFSRTADGHVEQPGRLYPRLSSGPWWRCRVVRASAITHCRISSGSRTQDGPRKAPPTTSWAAVGRGGAQIQRGDERGRGDRLCDSRR
jgi:alpha-amylase/alpha-mannosidase (GH57 family)